MFYPKQNRNLSLPEGMENGLKKRKDQIASQLQEEKNVCLPALKIDIRSFAKLFIHLS